MIKPPSAIGCKCEVSMPFTFALAQVPTPLTLPQVFAQPGPVLPVKHLYIDFAATGDRRHQMLDRADRHSVAVADRRAQPRINDVVAMRPDFGVRPQIRAMEQHTGVRRRRDEGHRYLGIAMKASTGAVYRRFQGALQLFGQKLIFLFSYR